MDGFGSARLAGVDHGSGIRLAELLVGLSAVADLGMGQPVGSSARSALVAVGLARAAGCDEGTVSDVLFAALLQHIGCTAYSHEATGLFADEISIKRASLETDFDRPREVVFGYLPTIVRDAPAGQKLRTARGALLHGRSLTERVQPRQLRGGVGPSPANRRVHRRPAQTAGHLRMVER